MNDDYTAGTYSKLAEVAEHKQKLTSPAPTAQPQARAVDGEQPTSQSSNRATVIPRHHDATDASDDDFVEVVRRAVKPLGERAATHRFTPAEKDAIADIVYALKKKGTVTSENEITRIAVNYLVWDYQQRKHGSILSRVLERLNA